MATQGNGPERTAYRVPGLSGPVEILVDRWGVPHIYATDTYDAFRAQGCNAARDRLWQIDFWRRRGLGRLAEVFGPEHVERRHRKASRCSWTGTRRWPPTRPSPRSSRSGTAGGVPPALQP